MRRFAPGWGRPARPRRRPPKRLILLVALVPLLAGLAVSPPNVATVRGDDLSDARAAKTQLQKQIDAQKKQVAELNAMQAGLRADIASTTTALKQVNADLTAMKAKIGQLTDEIATVRKAYDALVAQLQQLTAQVQAVSWQELVKQDQLAQRKAVLASRLRDAYATDRTTLLETFLSGGTFADILTQVGYYLDMGEQDKALAQQVVHDQQVLATMHESLSAARGQAEQLRVETAAQKAELDARMQDLKTAQAQLKKLQAQTARTLAAQKSAYAKARKNKQAAERAIAAAAAAQRQLQAQIDQLIRQRQQAGNIPSSYNGTFIWPAAGIVSQEFGCTGVIWEPPLGSCAHYHQGIDVAAPMYTPIRAAADGTVVFAGFNPYDPPPKAYIIIIAHSQSLVTWYAHLDASTHPATVHAGETVRQGQIIGYIGMTGNTTGPHLHWAVELNGDFVNPRLFL